MDCVTLWAASDAMVFNFLIVEYIVLKIVLTGGIGSGKTTVAKLFADLGTIIIDADQVARNCVEKNSPLLKKIQKKYGKEILTLQGELNRKSLREIIFNHPTDKKWLEDLLHPVILQEMTNQMQNAKSSYVIVVIPLYFETQSNISFDRILVVHTDLNERIKRIMKRDHCSEEMAKKIISQQFDEEKRLKRANEIILNHGNSSQLKKRVAELHAFYSDLAKNK